MFPNDLIILFNPHAMAGPVLLIVLPVYVLVLLLMSLCRAVRLFSFDICFPAVTAAICSFANKYSAFNLILNGKLYIFADMMTTDTTQGKAGTADN
jgi:hypothetical protein